MKKIENQIDKTTIQSSWNLIAKIIITRVPYSTLSTLIMLIVLRRFLPYMIFLDFQFLPEKVFSIYMRLKVIKYLLVCL